ncbi:MAG: VanZ family protein [Chlorobiales bacterium]|nr:VanZ family protein [Chlorobiales bacterium]
MQRGTLYKAAFYLWLVLIFIFSVIPKDAEIEELQIFDLTGTGFVKHLIAYFIAALLLILAYKNEHLKFIVLSLLLVFLGSILIEFIQYLLPYRAFSVSDMLANFLGIVLFFVPFWTYSVTVKSRVRPQAP